jgi:hypothetical protein
MPPRTFLTVLAVYDAFALGVVWLLAPRCGRTHRLGHRSPGTRPRPVAKSGRQMVEPSR